MTATEIVLDALAEVIAAENRLKGENLLLGISDVISAVCMDSGLDETDVRQDLRVRVTKKRAGRINIQLMKENL